MKNVSRLILFILVSSAALNAFGPKTFFTTRSQGVNAAIELAGWQQLINLSDKECNYGTLAIIPTYSRSFDSCAIEKFLLGSCSELRFTGSRVPDRDPSDIMADYFGLPSDFVSTVRFEPQITNFVFDVDFYQGLDAWWPGGYVRINMPICHTKWDLDLQECGAELVSSNTNVNFEPAGYWGPERVIVKPESKNQLYNSVKQAFTATKSYGDLAVPMQYGKIWGRQLMTRIADLQMAVGWNFLRGRDYHFGFNIRGTIPTGNAPSAEYLFEPIAGNMRHGELGGGLTTHYIFWRSTGDCHALGFYLDANITHLFTNRQKRSFDLRRCSGSRYMLLEAFGAPAENLFVAPGKLADSQYQRQLIPAINETTFNVDVKIAIQADIVAKLSYQHNGLEVDLGYNFYGRSREKLNRCQRLSGCLALKGDAQVYGFDFVNEDPVPLGVTQNGATIHGGQGVGNFTPDHEYQNINADFPVVALDANGVLTNLQPRDALALNLNLLDVNTSNPSLLLSDCDICEESAIMPRAISNKIFGYAGYWWDNPNGIDPYFGGGFAVEWAHPDPDKNSAFSQWQIWMKTGIAY